VHAGWGALLALAISACSGGGGAKPPGDGGAGGAGPYPEKASGVSVSDARARACEVVLTEGLREVSAISFASGVRGQWSRWAPRVAFAFTATADKPLGTVATLTLRIKGNEAQFPTQAATCYDRAGAKLDNSKVIIK
jgi:hypothetical protein